MQQGMPGRPPGSTSTTSGISFRTSSSAAEHRTKLQDFSLSVDTLRDRNKVKRLSAKHVIQVEYWISSIGSWTEKAQISISTKKTKLYLNVSDSYAPKKKIKFAIDSSLRIEHTEPLAKDFQLTFSGGGELNRHKVAFFNEEEPSILLQFFKERSVQIIRKRGGARRKSSANLTTLRPISEGFQGQEKSVSDTKENMAILRRKSTGSFDDVVNNSSKSRLKHTISTASNTLQRRNSMTFRSKKGVSNTKWYKDHPEDSEDLTFNKSRNSLETDDSEESYFNSDEEQDFDATDGFMSKLLQPNKNDEEIKPYIRPSGGNDKLEKYKFLLINIEQDEDILDPGTFGLMEDSYLGLEFNDYPSEVLCPNPTQAQQQCQDVPHPTSSSKLQDESSTPNWIRRSFETLLEEKSNNSVTTTLTLSQSTGNLAEVLKKSETELKSSETRSSIELEKEPAAAGNNNNNNNANKDSTSGMIIQEDIRRLLATGSPTLTECL